MAMTKIDQCLVKQAELQKEYAEAIAKSLAVLRKLADVQEELENALREEEDSLREQIGNDKAQQQEVK